MTLVAEFHEAFSVEDPQVPTPPSRERARRRLLRIEEEFKEVQFELRALMLSDEVNTPIDMRLAIMARLLKELCDLRYVVEGGAEDLGLGSVFEQAYHEVHRSNMSKLGADGKPIVRESDGKLLKGPNYKPADMEQFIDIHDGEHYYADDYDPDNDGRNWDGA